MFPLKLKILAFCLTFIVSVASLAYDDFEWCSSGLYSPPSSPNVAAAAIILIEHSIWNNLVIIYKCRLWDQM